MSSLEGFMDQIQEDSDARVKKLHHLAKRMWKDRKWSAMDVRNRCFEAWDDMQIDLNCKILPLVPVSDDRPITNLIFGSGSFSTGKFQVEQYEKVKKYCENPPVLLQGLVANKSEDHKCQASPIAHQYRVPLIELDFNDWYHEFIDKNEANPIRASRYWYTKEDPNRPSMSKINRRFKIRQDQFHKELGEVIEKVTNFNTDIASARGYNFQFCRNIFHHQKDAPHVNDTHPADLTYVDADTKDRLYPGWQAGAVDLMLKNGHDTFKGSLIEVDYMDSISQIDQLDEGSLLGIGKGVKPEPGSPMSAKEIQNAMKIIDDYFFCTLEPTGLYLLWGITDRALPVVYQTVDGKQVIIKQRVIVVGDKFHSGVNAWGNDFKQDMKELDQFLFS